MSRSKHGNHAFTGVFLVGLGIVAWLEIWWPYIMFVTALAMFVSALIDGRLGENFLAIVILLIIGVAGVLGHLHLGRELKFWPILFILLGTGYLVKTFWKRSS